MPLLILPVDRVSGRTEKVIWAKDAHQMPTSRKVILGARKGSPGKRTTRANPINCNKTLPIYP